MIRLIPLGIFTLLFIPSLFAQSGQYPYPLWPSDPIPGWPGVNADEEHTIEKLTDRKRPKDPRPALYGHPEFLAYPGAVHHLRGFLQRYLPPLPIYNHNTLHKNFILHQQPDYAGRCTDFAEPVYYNPMYGKRSRTKQNRPAVKVLPLKRGDTIKFTIGKLNHTLYALRPIVAAPGVTTVEEHKLLFFKLRINDLDDPAKMNGYILRAPCLDNFYAVTEFNFRSHADGREFRAELSLLPHSDIDVVLHNVDLHSRFGELARRRGKKRAVEGGWLPTDQSKWQTIWEKNHKKNPRQYDDFIKNRYADRTPEEQKAHDDLVWEFWVAPLNTNRGGWGWYLQKIDSTPLRLAPAPEEWKEKARRYQEFAEACLKSEGIYKKLDFKRLNPFLELDEGKAWLDTKGEYQAQTPAYQLKDVGVHKLGTWKNEIVDGKPKRVYAPGDKLGMAADLDLSGKTPLLKGQKADLNQIRFRGKLNINGKPVGNTIRETHLVSKDWRYFDETLRVGVRRIVEVKPGFYYDTNRLDWGSSVTSLGNHFHHISPWVMYGIRQNIRDQAMKFVRYVYSLPANVPVHSLAFISGYEGLDRALYKIGDRRIGSGALPSDIRFYDVVYPFLANDKEFVQAVGRYIPWIETPDDLITMLDTYLIQDFANNIMKSRSFTDHEQSKMMMTCVLIQDDTSISDPWMEFLFTRGWEYPQALSGFGDNIITGTTRDGGTSIGSYYYGLGGGMAALEMLGRYMQNGGNPKYDITDPRQCPSTRQKGYFVIEGSAAGRINPGIGDVGGPAEYYGRMVNNPNVQKIHEAAWRWTNDPKFAWELVNTWSRSGQSDEEWAEIEAAAKMCPRDPFLMNRSRILSDWNGFLTLHSGASIQLANQEWQGGNLPHYSNDPRLIREAAIRVGTGWGHEHYDTLDLRLFAFGLTMTGDFNQRKAYGKPSHFLTLVHNLVVVDRKNWMGHAWIRDLFDAPGSPYLTAESIAPQEIKDVKLYRRQVAMINVEDGTESKNENPLADPKIKLPSQYVFDVFRVSGGSEHAYGFHGCVDDGFDVNVKNKEAATGGFLQPFWPTRPTTNLQGGAIGGWSIRKTPEFWSADPDGNHLVATWKLFPKADKRMARGFAPVPGDKFTRLTLVNPEESRILHGIARSSGMDGYYGRCLYVVKGKWAETPADPAQAVAPTGKDSVFVALIEPYAGEPSIVSQRQLAIANNEQDALRAVAVEVKTNNGHTDLLFADGRSERVREIRNPKSVIRIAAEYAYVSRDAQSIRQATITGGKHLSIPGLLTLEVETARYEATVTKVSYLNRVVTLKGKIPERLAGHFFEVGNRFTKTAAGFIDASGNNIHKTSYEVSKIKNKLFGKTELTLRKGIEIMRTRVRFADPKTGKIRGAISMMRHRGRDRGLVASNDAITKLWRVTYTGGNRHKGHTFNLSPMEPESEGPAFTAADFPFGDGIRIWEFGPDDIFSIQTGVSIRRRGNGVYEVYATSPFKLKLGSKKFKWSADGKSWKALSSQDGFVSITETQLSSSNTLLIKAE